MKKMMITVILMIVSLGITFAQVKHRNNTREIKTPEEQAQLRTKRMSEALALNEQQMTKLQAVNLQQAKKMDELKNEYAQDRKEFREKTKAELDATEQAYKTILTPEQFEKYQVKKAQQIENRKNKAKSRREGRK